MSAKPRKNVAKKVVRKVSTPRSAVQKATSRPRAQELEAEQLKSRKNVGHHRTSGRSHHKRDERSYTNTEVARFNPRGTHQVLPREYFTKLTATYAGELAVGRFPANGLMTTIILRANDSVSPYAGAAGFGASATWMNSALTGTTQMTNNQTLLTSRLYNSVCVLATHFTLTWDVPATITNNGMIVALTPCINVTNPPTDVVTALRQPFTSHRTIQNAPASDSDATVSLYVEWSKFIGDDPGFYSSYPSYSGSVDGGGTYFAPTTSFSIVLNAGMMDQVAPSGPLPFTMKTTMYVKFYDFTNALI